MTNRHLLARIKRLEAELSHRPPDPQASLEAFARSSARVTAGFVSGVDLEETPDQRRRRQEDENLIQRWMAAQGVVTGDDGEAERARAKMLEFGDTGRG